MLILFLLQTFACANLFFLLLLDIFWELSIFCRTLCFLHLLLAFSDLKFMWSLSAISTSQQYHFEDAKWAHLEGSQWAKQHGCCVSQGPKPKQLTEQTKLLSRCTWCRSHFGISFTMKLLFDWSFWNFWLVSTSRNCDVSGVVLPVLHQLPGWNFCCTVDFLFFLKCLKLH